MIHVSHIVKDMLIHDEIAFEAFRFGYLNASSYARRIQRQVEEGTKKTVRIGTIIVALSRLRPEDFDVALFKPTAKIQTIGVWPKVSDITYSRNLDVLKSLSTFKITNDREHMFFAMTQGLDEVTVICSEKLEKEISRKVVSKPIIVIRNLSVVTIRFSSEYMSVPNAVYVFISALATERVNVIEIVSTYTELSFVLQDSELDIALRALKKLL